MFGKSKVSQAVIDAVNSVLEVKVEEKSTVQPSDSQRVPMAPAGTQVNLSEASEKVATPTGMKVYGSSYGNSKKARADQTKKDIDKLKGPKEKEMQEELKGDQHKIDANNNNKIDAQDFKILRGKKKVKEGREFTEKLLETVRKSDVPAYLRKAKGDTPLTVADVKAPKKDSISAPENLAKARNEEVEELDEKARFAQFTPGDQLAFRSLYAPGAPTKRGGTGAHEYGTKPRATTIAKKTQSLKDKIRGSAGKHGPTGKLPEEVVTEAKGIEVKKEYDDKKEAEHGVYHNGQKIGYVVHNKKHGVHTAYHSPQGDKDDEDYGQIDDFHSHHDAVSQIRHSAGVSMREEVVVEMDKTQTPPGRDGNSEYDTDAGKKQYTGKPVTATKAKKDTLKLLNKNFNKEEVELTEEQLDEMINEVLSKDASAGDWIHDFVHSDNPKFAGKSKAERKKMALGAYYGAQKESYEPADTAITTDTLAGRLPGGKSNSFKSYKLRVRPLAKEGEQKLGDATPEIIQPQNTPARKSHEVKEATIAGTPGWEKIEKNVKDKSGAVHTPMSRAKDLAKMAFKSVQDKTKIK